MSHPAPPLAVELYAFEREAFLNDMPGVLSRVADLGYTAVEGIPAHPVVYKNLLDERGLSFAAYHVTPKLMGDDFDTIIQYQEAMGSTHICNSGPMNWMERSEDDFLRTCEYLNKAGKVFKAAGQHLHYHNHEFEFNEVAPGRTAMDIILENFDFDVLDLCLDVGFAWQMQVDPAQFLRDHAERIGYLHLHDFKGDASVALGAGDMDLQPILAAALEHGNLPYWTVEQNPGSADVYADLTAGKAHMNNILSRLT